MSVNKASVLPLRKSEKCHYPKFTDRKDTTLRSELSCLRSHTRREWLHGIKPILLNACLVTQSQDCPSPLFFNKPYFRYLPFQKFCCQYSPFCGSHIVWQYLLGKMEKLLVVWLRAAVALECGGVFLLLIHCISSWQFKPCLLNCWGWKVNALSIAD